MKFSAAASIILAMSHGAHAFLAPSIESNRAASKLHSSAADPYASMLDAISSAADAANTAAQTSAQLASSLPHPSSSIINIDIDALPLPSTLPSIMTPEAISAAQAKLSILEANLATSSDPSVMTKAIMDALDASISYAEHAASSTSVLTHNLANFDTVLSNSMALSHSSFHLLPPESAELARANLAQLIHNLSGMNMDDDGAYVLTKLLADMDNKLDALTGGSKDVSANLAQLIHNMSDDGAYFFTNYLADVDRKLDALSAGSNGDVSASTVLLYSSAVFMLAYSQRQAGVRGYKEELRKMIEGGEFDINVLAADVGLEAAIETTREEAKKQLEDPAISMAAIEEPEPAVSQNQQEEETQKVEALLTTADAELAKNPSYIEEGEFEMNVLAEDVDLEANVETIKEEVHQQLEDPAIFMTASEEPEHVVPPYQQEEETEDLEALLTTVAAMLTAKPSYLADTKTAPVAAVTTPEVTATKTLSKKAAHTPKPPTGAIPMITNMKTAVADKIIEKVKSELAVVVESSKKKQVKVVAPKKKKRKAPAPPKTPASPLARLLADELGLDLASLGNGSGKNGKILIDDVRQFQAARESTANNVGVGNAYLATLSA